MSSVWVLVLPLKIIILSLFMDGCGSDSEFASRRTVTSQNAQADQSQPENPSEVIEIQPRPAQQEEVVINKSFDAAQIEDRQLELTNELNHQSWQMTLKAQDTYESTSLQQVSRPFQKQAFTQGSFGQEFTANLSQLGLGALDIVLVVDDSSSMHEEHEKLAGKLQPLISAIGERDWRLNLVTTSPERGCQMGFFRHNDSGVSENFRRTIEGLNSDDQEHNGTEQGIRQAVAAIKCGESDWIRPGSNIAVLIVSDADNCSDGSECDEPDETVAADYRHLLHTLESPPYSRDLGKTAKVYGIYALPNLDHDEYSCDIEHDGFLYHKAVQETKGHAGHICDSDYSDTLKAISQNIAELKVQFELPREPLGGRVEVLINGSILREGYSIDGRLLSFAEAPPRGAIIEARYRIGEDTRFDTITVDERLDPEQLSITIEGQPLSASDYIYTSGQLTFLEPPPSGSRIEVNYRLIEGRKSRFKLDKEFQDIVQILINDTPWPKDSFELKDQELSFLGDLPPDDAVIQVHGRTQRLEILEYPIQGETPLFASLNIRDLQTQEPIAVSLNENKDHFIIAPEDFQLGRALEVELQSYAQSQQDVVLESEIIGSTFEIVNLPRECHDHEIKLEGEKLQVSCPIGQEALIVKYQIAAQQNRSFDLGIKPPEAALYEVFINETSVSEFTVSGQIITINTELTPWDKVHIQARWNISKP